jgi:hypothetical protein
MAALGPEAQEGYRFDDALIRQAGSGHKHLSMVISISAVESVCFGGFSGRRLIYIEADFCPTGTRTSVGLIEAAVAPLREVT